MQIRETWEPILVYAASIYALPPLAVVLAGRLFLRQKLSERARSRMDTFCVAWTTVIPCLSMLGFIVLAIAANASWIGLHVVGATIFALLVAFFVWVSGMEAKGLTVSFLDTFLVGLCFFGALAFFVEASVLSDQKKAEEAARDAKFTQSVSYYLDANDRMLDGDTHTYPVSNIGVNAEGDTYVWVEKRSDGTLATRKSVKKVTDGRWEVVVKDDLPATDTEARVERRYEYALNPEEIAAGHKECISPISYEKADVALYGSCARNVTVKFVRAETIIHIPAGSAEKAVPVVAE